MKYLCQAYEEESKLNSLSKSEWDTLRRETLEYVEELRQRGQLISAEALKSVRTATTVRVRNGRLSITDGPFAETKETLGGFFLIEARDLNDAIRIASNGPRRGWGASKSGRSRKSFERNAATGPELVAMVVLRWRRVRRAASPLEGITAAATCYSLPSGPVYSSAVRSSVIDPSRT